MKKDAPGFGEIFLLVGLFFSASAVVFQQTATSLKQQGVIGGDPMGDAALYPDLLASLLLGFTAIRLVIIMLQRPRRRQGRVAPENLKLILLFFLLIVLYFIFMPKLGFHIATPVFGFFILLSLGVKWWKAVIFTLLQSLLLGILFETLLNVVLPVGWFELTLPF